MERGTNCFTLAKFNQLKFRIMTKQETTLLLEAVKNAPIVDGKITVTVCGTTFSFGDKWSNKITEDNREKLLANIGKACRARMTRGASKNELDRPAIYSQELMLWWKDNIGKTNDVLKAAEVSKAYHEKWDSLRWSHDYWAREKDYDKVVTACKKADANPRDIDKLAALRSSVPRAWEKA